MAVVGVGLMGGSLGLALRAADPRRPVRGVDPDLGGLRAALARGAISQATGSLEEAVAGATAVFLAAPVSRLGELARRALEASGPDCLVSDLGSTKAGVLSSLRPAERERFIGGHPVCGGESSGVALARADLFEGATWFLTPSAEARPELFARLHGLVASVGARPVAIDAAVHDRLMALVSHLPHILAGALVNQAAATAPAGREALRSAGPSFTDLTRVAGANPPLWADILLANRRAVLEALGAHAGLVEEVEGALARGDREWLLGFLGEAAEGRARLRAADSAPRAPVRIVIGVPNRPGVLSEIATALGHAHINIEDLNLRPGPPHGTGDLELVVAGPEAAAEALRLVRERGYAARSAPA